MKKNELISVIVPVYNVEKYLVRCIQSIVNQTYRNIELLLIDDGSTDSCGDICEEFAKIDNRIQVFHKKNGGQGSARNIGLGKVKGNYIAFLDSDDYMESNALESLYNDLVKRNLDISSCNYNRVNEVGKFVSVFDEKYDDFVVSGIEAVRRMWYHDVINLSPWGKIFKRELWENVLFDEYRYSEDYATMHKIYIKAKRFGYLSNPMINYTVRMNSSVRVFNDQKIEILDIADHVVEYIKRYCPELKLAAVSSAMSNYFHILMKIPSISGKYEKTADRCKKFISRYQYSVLKDPKVNKRMKCAIILYFIHPKLARFVYNKRKQRNILS